MFEVGGFVAGAGITLSTQVLLQFYVTPRVEARKRREDRWERDLVELTDLVAGELTKRANAASNSVNAYMYGLSRINDPDNPATKTPQMQELVAGWQAEAEATQSAFDDVAEGRVRLLLERVTKFSPGSRELAHAEQRSRGYQIAAMMTRSWTFFKHFDELPDGDKVERQWEDEHRKRQDLIKALAPLSGRPMPPRARFLERRRHKRKLRKTVPPVEE
jgi:hypothetical protein